MSIDKRHISLQTLAASLATAAIFLIVAAVAWGGSTTLIGKGDGEAEAVAVSPDGKLMAVSTFNYATNSHSTYLYKLEDNGSWVLVKKLSSENAIESLIFATCPDAAGQNILCLIGLDSKGRILVWDAKTGEFIRELAQLKHSLGGSLAVVPGVTLGGGSGRPIAVEGPDLGKRPPFQGTVQFVAGNGQLMGSPVPVPHRSDGRPVLDIGFSHDGTYVVTVGGPEGGKYYLCILGVTSKQCDKKVQLPHMGIDVDVSPYGKIVVTLTQGKGAYVIDKGSGQKVKLPDSEGVIACVFLSDGHTIACSFSDGTVRLYDDKGNKVGTPQLVCPNGPADKIARGPNNSFTVGCRDGSVYYVQAASTSSSPSTSPPPKQ